jgi:uncharacterized protein YlxW (UPF0749 family)
MARQVRMATAAALLAALAVLAVRTRPPSPVLRAPRQYQLAALVDREQATVAQLRTELAGLQVQVDGIQRADLGSVRGRSRLEAALSRASEEAGLTPLRGSGVQVTLDDSTLGTAPNVNDLVIHSQDVQDVVNALWRAGAQAIAINGQRVVGTSVVECVGNTLLLDGTLRSPPYVMVGIGASQPRFSADALVRELGVEASTYGLTFDVATVSGATAPAFRGQLAPRFASVAPRPGH